MTEPVPFVMRGLGDVANTASFILPLADLGAGAVDTSEMRSNATPTFTRATTAWTKLSSGLWASVASGTARSFYSGLDTTVGSYLGYLAEGARTNLCLQARDLSNASWTKSSTTGAKDQVGIDGTASSASSLVATGANGTCKQSITLASASDTFSVFVKRITGTGEVDITIDGGTTWVAITGSINSSTYTRVNVNQTVTNPSVGFRIVTSGDKIAVDMCQLEGSTTFASSPIPTTTVSVTRNGDVLSFPFVNGINATAGSSYAELGVYVTSTAATSYCLVDTGNGQQLMGAADPHATTVKLFDGVNTTSKTGLTSCLNTSRKRATSWGNSLMSATGDGLAVSSGTYGAFSLAGALGIGGIGDAASLFGGMKNIRIWNTKLSDDYLQALTA